MKFNFKFKFRKKKKKDKYIPIVKVSFKLFWFLYYKYKDFIYQLKHGKQFNEYGLTIYSGKQGAGKSISMTEYLYRMKRKFPNVKIYTNFFYTEQDGEISSWKDLLHVRNGDDGVIFAIDEIQNEFDSTKWKDFPEWLLKEVTQQRKQKVKIVGTSQVFTRVVKQLREQTYEVVECRTLAGRWTFQRCFDAEDYDLVIDNPEKKRKLPRKWRKSFIQTQEVRNLFDSYKKIEKLKSTEFIPKVDRMRV